jgi:hypothetical protein
MKAPFRQLERVASGTHYAPELLRLPLDTAKGCQGTIHNMRLQNMIQLMRLQNMIQLTAIIDAKGWFGPGVSCAEEEKRFPIAFADFVKKANVAAGIFLVLLLFI